MGRIFLLTALLFIALLPAAADTGQGVGALSTVRTPYFQVVAPDTVSAEFTGRACERLVASTRRWLRLPIGFIGNRIQVELRPAHRYRFPEPFHIRLELTGGVSVIVRWDADTELENLERALARAFLMRVAVWHGISDDRITVPAWLEAALQRSLRAAGNPSYADALARSLRDEGPLPLEVLLAPEGMEALDRRFADNAYWLLRHLEHQGRDSDRTHNLVIRLLGGGEPEAALMATFGSMISKEGPAQLWWAVGAYDRLQRQAATQSHFRDSQNVLRSFYLFFYRKDGWEIRLPVDELWEYRHEPLVRADLAQRVQRMNWELRTIHPFHYNAVLSLGRAMIALTDGNEDAFRESVSLFREDYADARRLFDETEEALDRLEEALEARPSS